MKISIALCTYNGASYLPAQLDSIRQQTHLPDELIICDDASTDDTLTVLEDFAQTVDFSVYVQKNPQNIGSTRNFEQAIRLCTRDIIALADQDDFWLPSKLELIAQQFTAQPAIGGVFTDASVVDENLQDMGYSLWSANNFTPKEQSQFTHGQAVPILLKKNVVTGATFAFRADLRERLLPINPLWVHDGWLAFILACIQPLIPISDQTMRYRQHTQAQLGAEKLSLTTALSVPTKAERYQHAAAQYQALHTHLSNLGEIDPAILDQIIAKIDHMQKRATLPSRRLARLKPIFTEIRQGRYHRYSAGWRSILRDLQRP